jgi:hypothetical protein
MRFMYIVTSPHAASPTPELLEAMHKLADREIKAGRMLDNGGLTPLPMGAQVRVRSGKLSVVDGPFVEAKEVIGGYADGGRVHATAQGPHAPLGRNMRASPLRRPLRPRSELFCRRP